VPKSSHKDDPDQLKRFIKTARDLECDEDEAAFDEKLRRIATVKPKPRAPKPVTDGKRARRSRT
jgi:hypothetical protein